MTSEQLKEGEELRVLIQQTSEGLNKMHDLKKSKDINGSNNGKVHTDRMYNLQIGKHNDRSGINADLNRYHGNEEVINAIIEVLTRQLENYKIAFKEL